MTPLFAVLDETLNSGRLSEGSKAAAVKRDKRRGISGGHPSIILHNHQLSVQWVETSATKKPVCSVTNERNGKEGACEAAQAQENEMTLTFWIMTQHNLSGRCTNRNLNAYF